MEATTATATAMMSTRSAHDAMNLPTSTSSSTVVGGAETEEHYFGASAQAHPKSLPPPGAEVGAAVGSGGPPTINNVSSGSPTIRHQPYGGVQITNLSASQLLSLSASAGTAGGSASYVPNPRPMSRKPSYINSTTIVTNTTNANNTTADNGNLNFTSTSGGGGDGHASLVPIMEAPQTNNAFSSSINASSTTAPPPPPPTQPRSSNNNSFIQKSSTQNVGGSSKLSNHVDPTLSAAPSPPAADATSGYQHQNTVSNNNNTNNSLRNSATQRIMEGYGSGLAPRGGPTYSQHEVHSRLSSGGGGGGNGATASNPNNINHTTQAGYYQNNNDDCRQGGTGPNNNIPSFHPSYNSNHDNTGNNKNKGAGMGTSLSGSGNTKPPSLSNRQYPHPGHNNNNVNNNNNNNNNSLSYDSPPHSPFVNNNRAPNLMGATNNMVAPAYNGRSGFDPAVDTVEGVRDGENNTNSNYPPTHPPPSVRRASGHVMSAGVGVGAALASGSPRSQSFSNSQSHGSYPSPNDFGNSWQQQQYQQPAAPSFSNNRRTSSSNDAGQQGQRHTPQVQQPVRSLNSSIAVPPDAPQHPSYGAAQFSHQPQQQQQQQQPIAGGVRRQNPNTVPPVANEGSQPRTPLSARPPSYNASDNGGAPSYGTRPPPAPPQHMMGTSSSQYGHPNNNNNNNNNNNSVTMNDSNATSSFYTGGGGGPSPPHGAPPNGHAHEVGQPHTNNNNQKNFSPASSMPPTSRHNWSGHPNSNNAPPPHQPHRPLPHQHQGGGSLNNSTSHYQPQQPYNHHSNINHMNNSNAYFNHAAGGYNNGGNQPNANAIYEHQHSGPNHPSHFVDPSYTHSYPHAHQQPSGTPNNFYNNGYNQPSPPYGGDNVTLQLQQHPPQAPPPSGFQSSPQQQQYAPYYNNNNVMTSHNVNRGHNQHTIVYGNHNNNGVPLPPPPAPHTSSPPHHGGGFGGSNMPYNSGQQQGNYDGRYNPNQQQQPPHHPHATASRVPIQTLAPPQQQQQVAYTSPHTVYSHDNNNNHFASMAPPPARSDINRGGGTYRGGRRSGIHNHDTNGAGPSEYDDRRARSDSQSSLGSLGSVGAAFGNMDLHHVASDAEGGQRSVAGTPNSLSGTFVLGNGSKPLPFNSPQDQHNPLKDKWDRRRRTHRAQLGKAVVFPSGLTTVKTFEEISGMVNFIRSDVREAIRLLNEASTRGEAELVAQAASAATRANAHGRVIMTTSSLSSRAATATPLDHCKNPSLKASDSRGGPNSSRCLLALEEEDEEDGDGDEDSKEAAMKNHNHDDNNDDHDALLEAAVSDNDEDDGEVDDGRVSEDANNNELGNEYDGRHMPLETREEDFGIDGEVSGATTPNSLAAIKNGPSPSIRLGSADKPSEGKTEATNNNNNNNNKRSKNKPPPPPGFSSFRECLRLRQRTFIAIHLIGVDSSKLSNLYLILISTAHTTYLVDMSEMKPEDFRLSGLATLFEDELVTKLTFDCRPDVEVLQRQFGVAMHGVCDLQVMATLSISPRGQFMIGRKAMFQRLFLLSQEDEEKKERITTSGCTTQPIPAIGHFPAPAVECCIIDLKYLFIAFFMLDYYEDGGRAIGEQRVANTLNGNYIKSTMRDF